MTDRYVPQPIDTTDVELNDEVAGLVSRLAANAHEIWAQQRMDDGWTYGPRRDDQALEHPSLVPFDALPESEKVYDLRMVTETLKAAIALGFTIERQHR